MDKKSLEVAVFALFAILIASFNPFSFDISLLLLLIGALATARELFGRSFAKLTKDSNLEWKFNSAITANSVGFKQDMRRITQLTGDRVFNKVHEIHSATIPCDISQTGAISADMSTKKKSNKSTQRTKSDNGDEDAEEDSDDDIKKTRRYTYQSAAKILDCSPQTLYNKVSCGLIPSPIKTPVGPRFSIEIIDRIASGSYKNTKSSVNRRRGRPRLAPTKGEK